MNIERVIGIVRTLKEEGAPTNSMGGGHVAGYDPVMGPPIDLRKKKARGWNIFFKDLVKSSRKKKKKKNV